MNLFRDSSIDFMKYRRFMVPLSVLLVIGSIAALLLGRLNVGIDFAGGTQLVVRFQQTPQVDELRVLLASEGIDPQIQRFGQEIDNEVIIKTPLVEGADEGSREAVVLVLDGRFNSGASGLDLNQQGGSAIANLLFEADPDDRRRLGDEAESYYDGIAEKVMVVRRQHGLISGWEEIEGLEGVSGEVVASLKGRARLGAFAILGAENVGPQIGSELRRKGVLAVVFSLVGMMAYIWYRFELRFGLGALVALVHDVIIALGLYTVLGYEFDLTTIAAFLTLVGYSVNDSVVIFDRVRENLRRSRRDSLSEIINRSLNQTLSRTVLTSGTTLLVVGTLFAFGGDVLRGFSFVLTIGVVVGTYSSIFIASPVMLLWERLSTRRR